MQICYTLYFMINVFELQHHNVAGVYIHKSIHSPAHKHVTDIPAITVHTTPFSKQDISPITFHVYVKGLATLL